MMKSLLLYAFSLVLLVPPSLHARVVEKIMASVSGRIITLSDVRRYIAFFLEKEKTGTLDEEAMEKQVLQTLIDEVLLLAEARRFGVEDPPSDEVGLAIAAVKRRFPKGMDFTRLLASHAVTEEEFRQEVINRLVISRFIDQRINFFVFIPDDEVESYYEAHREEFEGKTSAQVRETIHRILFERKAREKLEEYLIRLRSRAVIKSHPESPQ